MWMLAIQVPTLIRRVASIASNPASSASIAIVLISEARHPAPGMIPRLSRSAILGLPSFTCCADTIPAGSLLKRRSEWMG
jgi:hypothetical protein